jgi:hypothetical protein
VHHQEQAEHREVPPDHLDHQDHQDHQELTDYITELAER